MSGPKGRTGDLEDYVSGMKVLLVSEDASCSPDLFAPRNDHHYLQFKVQASTLTESLILKGIDCPQPALCQFVVSFPCYSLEAIFLYRSSLVVNIKR